LKCGTYNGNRAVLKTRNKELLKRRKLTHDTTGKALAIYPTDVFEKQTTTTTANMR
jgi:hypothetical protein